MRAQVEGYSARIFVLKFITDAASANLKLFYDVSKLKPVDRPILLFHQRCDMCLVLEADSNVKLLKFSLSLVTSNFFFTFL